MVHALATHDFLLPSLYNQLVIIIIILFAFLFFPPSFQLLSSFMSLSYGQVVVSCTAALLSHGLLLLRRISSSWIKPFVENFFFCFKVIVFLVYSF